MKKVMIIALILVGALLIPAVSAEEIYNETFIEDKHLEMHVWSKGGSRDGTATIDCMVISPLMADSLMAASGIKTIHHQAGGSTHTTKPSDSWDVTLTTTTGQYVGSGEYLYFNYQVGDALRYDSYLIINDFNGDAIPANRIVMFSAAPPGSEYPKYDSHTLPSAQKAAGEELYSEAVGYWVQFLQRVPGTDRLYTRQTSENYVGHDYYVYINQHWENRIKIVDYNEEFTHITIQNDITPEYQTTHYVTTQTLFYQSIDLNKPWSTFIPKIDYPIEVALYNRLSETWHNRTISLDSSTQPTPNETPTAMRTGTVTMTDHNGTSIFGFEVTAVNAYTGESYNVSTDTDVAVMTLPMDRTTEIRNPQTGVYETAPIGYYRFYGQAPGYKMLFEDGIQVAVMTEKYSSYKLCDIGVMSDSGPLTGKHKFQIRSRSDNSILQTGTISAKSATTGEWYNTTVSGGIATLILPYDTSNSQSQYAGNYYVYPTSPGYEDNDFGTQIVVMPHTVSEIKTIYLTPIGGIPTPGNVTLRIQAISETGPGVVNAEIFIAGVLGAGASVWDTYTASSTGYLEVSVPGNSTYDIVARGAGFYDSSRRIQVFDDDPDLIEMRLYLSGAPTQEPTTPPTGWPTDPPATKPPGGIPDDDDDSEGFLMQAVRGIGLAFGVGFSTAKIIFGMLLALAIGFATAKQLRGGAAEFGMGLLGGTMLGVLIGLLPVWIIVVLLLVVGLYIGNRYVGGTNNG